MVYKRGGTQKEIYTDSEVEYISCPLCGAGDYKQICMEREALTVVRCQNCRLIYVNPRLKHPEQIYWGDAEEYIKEARLIFEGKTGHHRDKNYIRDLKLISKYKPLGNFLDIGTNMGFFLRCARKQNWNLYGIEPSISLSEIARKYFNLNVKTGLIQDAGFDGSFFDVVTMTDVFEHLPEPGGVLNEVYRILKSDGILFIKVPNGYFNLFKYHLAKASHRLDNHDIFDSYEHVAHYSQSTLRLILKKYGFKVIKCAIGRPIQIPVWHNYVGQYYLYSTPWILDPVRQSLRNIFYWLSIVEYWVRFKKIGYLAPNITTIARKV